MIVVNKNDFFLTHIDHNQYINLRNNDIQYSLFRTNNVFVLRKTSLNDTISAYAGVSNFTKTIAQKLSILVKPLLESH